MTDVDIALDRPAGVRARAAELIRSNALVAQVLWLSTPTWTIVATACTVVGAVATAFVKVAAGHLLAALPAAVSGDDAAASTAWAWFVVLAAVLVGSQLVSGAQSWAAHVVSARFLRHTYDLVAETGVAPRGIERLDQPGYAGRLDALVGFTRSWQFVRGLDGGWEVLATRLSAIGSLVLVMQWRWWPGLIVAAAYLAMARPFAQWIDASLNEMADAESQERRRARYYRDLMTHAGPAKELRLFGWSDWLAQRYRRTWMAVTSGIWRESSRTYLPRVVVSIAVGGACMTGTYVLLARDVRSGTVSAAVAIIVIQAVLGLSSFGPLGDAQTGIRRIATVLRRLIALRREVDLPDLTPTEEPATAVAAHQCAAAIRMEQTSFTYPTRETATLRDLSLTIPAGQAIAIVGVNGAGKSTLIKLLAGLYRSEAGTVRIDGADPSTDDSARRRVAVIFQDFVRYPLSLRDNIAFGALQRRDDQHLLDRALADAGGVDVLDRIEGWDTVLSAEYAGGTNLSGGQWQRVALARALAAIGGGAGVLVLDEPTAALDVRAEAALFERFLEVTQGVTTILVSHRLSSVRRADRIVVLDGDSGRISEDGTHEQLMAAGGAYAQMFTLQAERFAAAGGMADALVEPDADES